MESIEDNQNGRLILSEFVTNFGVNITAEVRLPPVRKFGGSCVRVKVRRY